MGIITVINKLNIWLGTVTCRGRFCSNNYLFVLNRSALDNIWKVAEKRKVDILRLDKSAMETLSGKKPHQVLIIIVLVTAL